MELLYRGFDGLDVSFKGHIPHCLAEEFEKAKAEAAKLRHPSHVRWNGIAFNVSDTGARGGYAFKASTGQFGATWFFKRYSRSDPWGIRVSCNSFFLATSGLGQARTEIYRTLEALGVTLAEQAESIGRVDYCMDFLIPDFELAPDNFVMHSKASRRDEEDPFEKTTNGRSGRVTSVTVGRMPGRQIIVYDKRTEVIARHKPGWWEIWDAQRIKRDCAILDRTNRNANPIWRVEIRAGKRHLKDRWAITTWSDLDARFGDLVVSAIGEIRYCAPSSDNNRARWPKSALWQHVHQAVLEDLFEMTNCADPDLVRQVQIDALNRLLFRQITGSLVTMAGIRGVEINELAAFVARTSEDISAEIELRYEEYHAKLNRAKTRTTTLSH